MSRVAHSPESEIDLHVAGMHGTAISSEEDDDDRVLLAPHAIPPHARTGSSSSSAIDFLDYPLGVTGMSSSPSKGPGFNGARATPTGRIQAKNAFKNSVTGSTPKERLQQMGVGAASDFFGDNYSDSSEQYSQTRQHPMLMSPGGRLGLNQLTQDNWHSPSPSNYGLGVNGRYIY